MQDPRVVRGGKSIGNSDEQFNDLPPRAVLRAGPRAQGPAVSVTTYSRSSNVPASYTVTM
jgi:hypothetical protein